MFCGGRPVRNEHVWPLWFSQLLLDNTPATGFWMRHRSGEIFYGREITRQIKRFCEPCNSGWMSELENYSKPILRPLMLSLNRRTLFPATQAMITVWAWKTMLVMCSELPGSIPERFYHHFYYERQLPLGLEAWVAAVGGDAPNGGGVMHKVSLEDIPDLGVARRDAYAATIHSHRLCIQLFLYDGFGQPLIGIDEPATFQRVWPPHDPYVVWGNSIHLDPAKVEAVLRSEATFY
jgi:hypothetical protein